MPHLLRHIVAVGVLALNNFLLPALADCTKCGPDALPCGPGNDICVSPGAKNKAQYTFHLSDVSCAINDPNGPFYDARHGVYHLFYQDHLAEPNPVGLNAGAGPDWGHWVSRDFLPVVILQRTFLD